MSSELIKYDPTNKLPAEMQDFFEQESVANLEGVSPRLPKVQMPTGKGKQFTLEQQGGDEEKQVTDLTGIILYQSPANAYWEKPFGAGESVIPDCASHDGIKPSPQYPKIQAESCAGCRHNIFGSARSAEGDKLPGKACRNVKRVMLLILEDPQIPYLFTIPPSSLKNFDDYMVKLRKERRPYWTVVTKFTIKTEKSKSGIDYPQVNESILGFINDKEQIGGIDNYKREWTELFKTTQFTGGEVITETAPTPVEEYDPPSEHREF